MAFEGSNKPIKLGRQVLTSDDLRIKVEYKGEIFILRYPTPVMKAAIESEIARRLGGVSREAYPVSALSLVEASTYVDNLMVREECPAWFESPWTCYDEVLIGELYAGYLRFRDGFQTRLRTDGFQSAGKGNPS